MRVVVAVECFEPMVTSLIYSWLIENTLTHLPLAGLPGSLSSTCEHRCFFGPLQPHSSVLPRPCSGHCLPTWLWLSSLPFTSLSGTPILWAAESNMHCWCQHLYQTPLPWTPDEDASRVVSPFAWSDLTQLTPLYLFPWGFFSQNMETPPSSWSPTLSNWSNVSISLTVSPPPSGPW